jgi:YHS domain-containing protein
MNENESKTKGEENMTLRTCLTVAALALGVAAFALAQNDHSGHAHETKAAEENPQAKDYPLDTCPVSGKKLGSMGEPVDYLHDGRLVRFCCKGCIKRFQAEPEKYLEKLDAAAFAKQKKDYPLDTCVVSGEKLGSMGEPVDYLHDGRLVRFCCKGCIKGFHKDPEKFLKKLDAASKAKAEEKK